jgi:hypothetical protein
VYRHGNGDIHYPVLGVDSNMTEKVVVTVCSNRSGPNRKYHKASKIEACPNAPKEENRRYWPKERATDIYDLAPCKSCHDLADKPGGPQSHLQSIQEHVQEEHGEDIFDDGWLAGQQ